MRLDAKTSSFWTTIVDTTPYVVSQQRSPKRSITS
jgi:hypothetical protein